MVVVDIECSPLAPCSNITFISFDVATVNDTPAKLICQNVMNERGLSCKSDDDHDVDTKDMASYGILQAPCNETGMD